MPTVREVGLGSVAIHSSFPVSEGHAESKNECTSVLESCQGISVLFHGDTKVCTLETYGILR